MDFADIQTKKLELIQWLSSLDDISVINKIIGLRNKENTDWWDFISESEKQSIYKGISDADTGKVKPHSDARKLYEKWLLYILDAPALNKFPDLNPGGVQYL